MTLVQLFVGPVSITFWQVQATIVQLVLGTLPYTLLSLCDTFGKFVTIVLLFVGSHIYLTNYPLASLCDSCKTACAIPVTLVQLLVRPKCIALWQLYGTFVFLDNSKIGQIKL